MHSSLPLRLRVDGKFFTLDGVRKWLKIVTYGPFPLHAELATDREFRKIRAVGFDAIRLFQLPEQGILDVAEKHGLLVFAGLDWDHFGDFISRPSALSAARVKLSQWLKRNATHPALAGVYVGNEIPTDIVRWMGPLAVRRALEDLIQLGRSHAPQLLFAYANFPSTEYLEPENADFTAFNVYLESADSFAAYLRRLHNIAGDRPVMISEFGLDTQRHGYARQAEVLVWALEAAHREECAGCTIYAWSDLWMNSGQEVLDWDFGINDRSGNPKPALAVCADFSPTAPVVCGLKFSVIVCTRNGALRITACLRAIQKLAGVLFEIIVVDDGSQDCTAELVRNFFPAICLISIPPSGLSAARNIGAAHAREEIVVFTDDDCEPDMEWLSRLGKSFANPEIAAAGGPNLTPRARSAREALVSSAPGAPSHVLLDDCEAEHLPGCNIAVRRSVFFEIGGFDPVFQSAGDDVDFCWRLSDAGYRLGFVPGAYVWHWRRPSIRAYLKQQIGYGRAEKLLIAKHPHRFSKEGDALWRGCIYSGVTKTAQDDSLIYYGKMGQAFYQSISDRMQPLRPLPQVFQTIANQFILRLLDKLQPVLRSWARSGKLRFPPLFSAKKHAAPMTEAFSLFTNQSYSRSCLLEFLLKKGWHAASETDEWDLEKDEARLLIATETSSSLSRRHLFRFWGDPREAYLLKQELEHHITRVTFH